MKRTQVNAISAAVMSLIEKHKDEYPELSEYNISQGSGRFSSGYFDMKLTITEKPTESSMAKKAASTTQQMVENGFAPAGTPVQCGQYSGVIVKARRTRYLIEGVDGKYIGKQFTYPIRGTRLREVQTT